MKGLGIFSLFVGIISFILAVITRLMLKPLGILPGGVEAITLLSFTNTALLFAIVFLVMDIAKKK